MKKIAMMLAAGLETGMVKSIPMLTPPEQATPQQTPEQKQEALCKAEEKRVRRRERNLQYCS